MALKQTLTLFIAISCTIPLAIRADSSADPCGGSDFMLSLVDRPTVGDSACVVPFKQVLFEFGYQYQNLDPKGHSQNYPEAEIRVGLPYDSEFVIVSNYTVQSDPSASGFNAIVTGIKHRLSYTSDWVLSIEGLVTLPSGSADFGSKKYGGALNGILNYNINPKWSIVTMLGLATQSTSSSDGGRLFTSFNPDIVLTWAPIEKLNIYAEFYAQTKSSPDKNFGMNFDGGLLYLVTNNITVDVEIGHRLSGDLGSFDQYIGAGFAFII